MTESVWNESFNVISNFRSAAERVPDGHRESCRWWGCLWLWKSFPSMFFHPMKGVNRYGCALAIWTFRCWRPWMTESVWNESFNVMLNCNCFQTATRVVSLVRISLAVALSNPCSSTDESVIVMAAHRQRRTFRCWHPWCGSVWERTLTISNCSCFQTATRVVSLVRISLSVKVYPALFFQSGEGVVVTMLMYRQFEISV